MDKKPKMPTPAQRPDLYDAYDYPDRPKGYKNGCRLPASLQKMADEKKNGTVPAAAE